MASQSIHLKTALVMVVVFLALVGLHLWSGREEETGDEGGLPTQSSEIRIRQGDEIVEIGSGQALSRAELGELLQSRMRLLRSGETNERRVAAIQIAHMATNERRRDDLRQLGASRRQELQGALLEGLSSGDRVVAANCREALLGLWRTSDNSAATRLVDRAVSAYEAGQYDRALEIMDVVERGSDSVPPDLYRVRAEIYLRQDRPAEALRQCGRAARAMPQNFAALYTLSRVFLAMDEEQKARKALEGALKLYPTYPEALELRRRLQESEQGRSGFRTFRGTA
ncbi:MAG: tetratricopeptide repeat protein [Planctomycetota bacterium]